KKYSAAVVHPSRRMLLATAALRFSVAILDPFEALLQLVVLRAQPVVLTLEVDDAIAQSLDDFVQDGDLLSVLLAHLLCGLPQCRCLSGGDTPRCAANGDEIGDQRSEQGSAQYADLLQHSRDD